MTRTQQASDRMIDSQTALVKGFRGRSRNPMFTYYAATHLAENRGYLNRLMKFALKQQPRDPELITTIKEKIKQNETAIALSPTMTKAVRDTVQKLLDKEAPLPDKDDPSAAITKGGVLNAEQLRKKVQRNIQRVKINGVLISGTANNIASYVAWMQNNQRYMQDQQIQRLVITGMNNIHFGIEHAEEEQRENLEHDSEQQHENAERFSELYREACDDMQARELTNDQVEPGADDDLWSDIGLHHTAEERGLDMAFDTNSAVLEAEREAALMGLEHEFNTGAVDEAGVKAAVQNIERGYNAGSERLARAYTVLKDPEARTAWEKKFSDPEQNPNGKSVPEGPENNPALSPRSAADLKQSLDEIRNVLDGPKPPQAVST